MTDDDQEDAPPPHGPDEGEQSAAPPPPPPAALAWGFPGSGPPPVPPVDRIHAAWRRRDETDYIFDYWTALGWTLLTLGIYSFYVFYQLVRRMRDHNVRRVELLDAALAFAWEEAGRRDLHDELTPSFQRANAHMDVLRRMTGDLREPAIWLVLAFVARGIVEIIAFVVLDQDLVKHDTSEVGVEYELSMILGRLGQAVPGPDQARVKGRDNYAGRILATVFTFGIYLFWWYYNQMDEPNRHFRTNWAQEDALVAATRALR
jgi:hypothetical protein